MSGSELFIPRPFPEGPDEDPLLALSPRGDRIAVSHQFADHVQTFDTRSGKPLARLDGFTRVSGVLFLSAEVLLVTAFGGAYRCDLRRGSRDLLSDKGWQTGVGLSPDGRMLAIGVQWGMLLYDLAKGEVLRQVGVVYDPSHVGYRAAFSACGRYAAAALYGDRSTPIVAIWEVSTGRRQRVYDTLGRALAFRGDTLTLAVSADSGYVEVYEPDQGEALARQFSFQYRTPRAMESRDEDRTLAMLLEGGEFVQIDWDTGEVLRQLPPPAGHKVGYIVVASAGWTHFAGAVEGGVVVWPGDRAEPDTAADGGGL